MKLSELKKQAALNIEVETCDPCRSADTSQVAINDLERTRSYEDGMREGGQAFAIRELIRATKQKHEAATRTIPRIPGMELPVSAHEFLPMVCCSRGKPDAHLGAVED
jgi:hypothetical protein